MLKVVYIATDAPQVKPKKLTPKQQLLEEAKELVAMLHFKDKQKALKKYAPMIAELEEKKAYLKKLLDERK